MILRVLADQPGHIVTREEILDRVWGYEVFPSTRTIDNFIVRLRKRFERNPEAPAHFHTVRGVGYRFTAEPQPSDDADRRAERLSDDECTNDNDKLLLKAIRREAVPRRPLWIMRQAGRYLPEYREFRAEAQLQGARRRSGARGRSHADAAEALPARRGDCVCGHHEPDAGARHRVRLRSRPRRREPDPRRARPSSGCAGPTPTRSRPKSSQR